MNSEIQIKDKVLLTVNEAAAYSNIGIKKIYELTNNPLCSFVIFVGKKRLVKRKEFETFLSKNVEI